MDEQIIRSTDNDALSCRHSIVEKGYINDPYLPPIITGVQKFLKYDCKTPRRVLSALVKPKLPVINRGSYIRIQSIDIVIEKFLQRFKGETTRIINLGAGSDTRSFQLLHNMPDKSPEIIEIDFPDSVKFKKAVILDDETLCSAIGVKFEGHSDLDQFYHQLDNSGIEGGNYRLIPLDLRETDKLKEILKELTDKPTLIISECMLCYLNTKESNELLHTLHDNIKRGSLVVYDPMGGEGSFGNVMIDNLKLRNLPLSTLLEFNTLQKYKTRLLDIGFDSVKINHMYNILNQWLDPEEIKRISRLEFLDEIEELKLLLEHYCLSLSTWGVEFEPGLKFMD